MEMGTTNELKFWENWFSRKKETTETKESILNYNYNKLMGIPHGHDLAFFQDKIIADVAA